MFMSMAFYILVPQSGWVPFHHSPLIATELKDRLRFIQFLLSQPYNPGTDWVLHASLGNHTVMILSI